MVLKFEQHINEINRPGYLKGYMKEHEDFKIGDRIIYKGSWAKNQTGKVVEIVQNYLLLISGELRIGIEFDKKIGVHNCGGKGKMGHCLYTTEQYIKKIQEFKEEDIEWF
jgi:hypothetical protein